MPDWFYRTLAQPFLFRLPDKLGRALALGTIGRLGSNVVGRGAIDFMGHMAADPRLAITLDGVAFSSPIGLGWRVDPERRATHGLARFGVGCIEILEGAHAEVTRGGDRSLLSGECVQRTFLEPDNLNMPILRRGIDRDGYERILLPAGQSLPVLPWDCKPGDSSAASSSGVVLQNGARDEDGRWRVSARTTEDLVNQVSHWRRYLGEGKTLVVAGGVGGPEDALRLIDVGADLLLVDAGLVFHGPGLVKRCNEALLARSLPLTPEIIVPQINSFRLAWVWAFALGAGLMVGGLAALFLAATRVLLPYDEHYLGFTAESLRDSLPLVFDFMAHDRGTLAGTMIGLGGFYMTVACKGIRAAVHGSKSVVVASALGGFASFFSFFGFGYFDTLHAFVAVVLFQLTVQIMVGSSGGDEVDRPVADHEDCVWRRAQWGQLCWVVHAVGLLGAGFVILAIGMSSVFVSEDLEFLCISAEDVPSLGTRMIAVVAHDRATLGGMLLASGVAALLSALWLYRRGSAWIWWAMLLLGTPAYAAALGFHFRVGYTDSLHLAPALIGFALWTAGLVLSHRYLRPAAAPSAVGR